MAHWWFCYRLKVKNQKLGSRGTAVKKKCAGTKPKGSIAGIPVPTGKQGENKEQTRGKKQVP